MTVSNVGLYSSLVNAKNRLSEKNVVKTSLTAFGRMLIAYTLATTTVFAAFTAMFGFNTTLWVFTMLFSLCTLGFLAVWWQEERQLSRVAGSNDPFVTGSALVASSAADRPVNSILHQYSWLLSLMRTESDCVLQSSEARNRRVIDNSRIP
jgi:hypothetical protein